MADRAQGRGMVTSTISAIRDAGPLVIGMILSDSRMASSTSCVTINTGFRVAFHIWINSSWITPLVNASICAKGSSSNSTVGSMEHARANPTRCFIPPDSAAGFLFSAP